MSRTKAIVAVGVCCAGMLCPEAKGAPAVFILDGEQLALAKTAVTRQDPDVVTALAHLVAQAEAALKEGPFSVVHKTVMPPSGNKQDYLSFGPYWWPNPDTDDGLPYIRKDGKVNPAARTDGSDSPRLGKMARSAETLALAYYFTGKGEYAAHAARLLRTWFLDAETRMNPHLQFGQGIPGRVDGRGTGILDTSRLTQVVDAVGILEGSPFWSAEEHEALKDWFRAYLAWLQTSPHGREEQRAKNNHGTFYDAQVACFALFVGDVDTARNVLESVIQNRIAKQIVPDGRQPHELGRPIAFHYSRYNLEAMFLLARLAEHIDLDLWTYRSDATGGIRAAFDYVAPYADGSKQWTHGRNATDRERSRLLPLLRQGFHAYGDPAYLRLIQLIPEEHRDSDASRLRFPSSLLVQQGPLSGGEEEL